MLVLEDGSELGRVSKYSVISLLTFSKFNRNENIVVMPMQPMHFGPANTDLILGERVAYENNDSWRVVWDTVLQTN